MTVNPLKAFDRPYGLAIFNIRGPMAAFEATVRVIGKLMSVPPGAIVAVMPVPLNNAPTASVRLDPLTIADMFVPCRTDEGEIPVITGNG